MFYPVLYFEISKNNHDKFIRKKDILWCIFIISPEIIAFAALVTYYLIKLYYITNSLFIHVIFTTNIKNENPNEKRFHYNGNNKNKYYFVNK